MKMRLKWETGVFAPSLKEQAEAQGVVIENVEYVQKILFGIDTSHFHGIITDAEYDRIMERFVKKVIEPKLRLKDNGDE